MSEFTSSGREKDALEKVTKCERQRDKNETAVNLGILSIHQIGKGSIEKNNNKKQT